MTYIELEKILQNQGEELAEKIAYSILSAEEETSGEAIEWSDEIPEWRIEKLKKYKKYKVEVCHEYGKERDTYRTIAEDEIDAAWIIKNETLTDEDILNGKTIICDVIRMTKNIFGEWEEDTAANWHKLEI